MGLGLAALRLLTGSLLPSMVAHAVLNTITFLTVFLSGAASEAMEQPQVLSGLLFLAGGARPRRFSSAPCVVDAPPERA